MSQTPPAVRTDRTTDLSRLLTFVAIAYLLAWLIILPLWLNGRGLATPGATVFLVLMMSAPAAAAMITRLIFPDARRFLDPLLIKPGSPRRWVLPALVGWLGIPVAAFLAMIVAVALGFLKADFLHFSGFVRQLRASGALPRIRASGLPIWFLVALQLIMIPPGGLINTLAAIGEELGWRAYLQPLLSRIGGRWVGIVGTGIIWGLWHAPIVLLGYNFPALPGPLRLVWMIIGCIILSAIFGYLVERAGTVWVSALAHGTLNASGRLPVLFVAAGAGVNAELVTVIGVTGWIVSVVFFIALRLIGGPADRRS